MKPTTINYVNGDATQPIGEGPQIICHVCNDAGVWGRGFVLAVSKRWALPEYVYRNALRYPLGDVHVVAVADSLTVVNMVAQHGIRSGINHTPLDYAALDCCLFRLAEVAMRDKASVHMPRIGCGLAGGSWDKIEPLIQKHLCDAGVSVTVYDWGGPE